MTTNTKIAYWLHDRAAEMFDSDDDAFADAVHALAERLLREEAEKAAPAEPRKPVAGWHTVPFSDGLTLGTDSLHASAFDHCWWVMTEPGRPGPMRKAKSLVAAQLAAEDALRAIADRINGVLRGGL